MDEEGYEDEDEDEDEVEAAPASATRCEAPPDDWPPWTGLRSNHEVVKKDVDPDGERKVL